MSNEEVLIQFILLHEIAKYEDGELMLWMGARYEKFSDYKKDLMDLIDSIEMVEK